MYGRIAFLCRQGISLCFLVHIAVLSSSAPLTCTAFCGGRGADVSSSLIASCPPIVRSCCSSGNVFALRGGNAEEAGTELGLKGAEQTMEKAEQIYRSTVIDLRQKNRPESSCLKAVTNFLFTGNVGGAGSHAKTLAKRDEALEQAAELFAAAALQLKLGRNMREAGRALLRSGDCYARHSDLAFQGPAQYAEAAKVLRQKYPAEAIVALGRAADMSVKCPGACNLQRAGRLRCEQAELYELAGNVSAALGVLEQAAEYFESDGASSAAASCRLRIADLLAVSDDLPKARLIFEALVAEAFNSQCKAAAGLPCSSLRFRAGLCYLAGGEVEQLEAVLDRYSCEDLAFVGSEVHTRLLALLNALVASDLDAFNKVVRHLGDSAGTDKVVTSLLLKTKQAVARQGTAGSRVAQRLAAQDDDDLL